MKDELTPGHVVFASDDRGFPQLQVAIYSLLKTADPRRPLTVTVFTGCGGLSDEHVRMLQKTARIFPLCRLEVRGADDFLSRYAVLFADPKAKWCAMTWIRCFIGELFPQESGNVVYLDIDTLVCEDLGPLFETDLSDRGDGRPYVLGAVAEEHRESAAENDMAFFGGLMDTRAVRYFNAGILLMNVRAFREESLLEKIMTWYAAHKEQATRLDQDALNAMFWDRTLFLHPRYNHSDGWLERQLKKNVQAAHWRGNPPREVLEAVLNPAVLHFWGSKKPWRWNHRPEGWRYESAMRELGVLTGSLPGSSWMKDVWRRLFSVYHALLRHLVRRRLRRLEASHGR